MTITVVGVTTAQAAWSEQAIVSAPAGLQEDDIVVISAIYNYSSAHLTGPSGFAELFQNLNSDHWGVHAVYYKVAGASEPSSYEVTRPTNYEMDLACVVLRGVDTSDPIDAWAWHEVSAALPTSPTVTTTVAGALLLCDAFIDSDSASLSAPAGMTELWSQGPPGGEGSLTHGGAWEQLGSPGATGTRQWAGSSGEPTTQASSIAFKPDASGPDVTAIERGTETDSGFDLTYSESLAIERGVETDSGFDLAVEGTFVLDRGTETDSGYDLAVIYENVTVSSGARAALFAQETGEAFLVLLTIYHADLAAPIRVVNNTEDITSRLETFVAFPFEIELPDDTADRDPVARVTIDNVSREIAQAIRTITSPATVLVEIVRASDPDTPEYVLPSFVMRNVKWTVVSVTADLVLQSLITEPFPAGRFDPVRFPGLAS